MNPIAKQTESAKKPIAPIRHTIVLIVIMLLISIGGAALQKKGPAESQIVSQHTSMLPLYVSLIVMEWLLVFFIWRGVRQKGVRLMDLIRGKWKNPGAFFLDFAIAIGFWIIWTSIGYLVKLILGPDSAKTVDVLLPQGFAEIVTWILLSVSAGICEEIVYRGYLQQQFTAVTGSAIAGVVIQGILFGMTHGYQGLKMVVTISVYGILFGILANARQSLRPGIISHAWTDIFSGFLQRFF